MITFPVSEPCWRHLHLAHLRVGEVANTQVLRILVGLTQPALIWPIVIIKYNNSSNHHHQDTVFYRGRLGSQKSIVTILMRTICTNSYGEV